LAARVAVGLQQTAHVSRVSRDPSAEPLPERRARCRHCSRRAHRTRECPYRAERVVDRFVSVLVAIVGAALGFGLLGSVASGIVMVDVRLSTALIGMVVALQLRRMCREKGLAAR
jgi:hypothetical protein